MASVVRRGAQYLLRGGFFNRTELRALQTTMVRDADSGSLLLLTGPPDSGKSALLEAFASWQWTEKRGFPITINMRAGTFSSALSFAQELQVQAKSSILPALAEFSSSILSDTAVKDAVNQAAGGAPVAEVAIDGVKNSIAAVHATNPTDMQALIRALESLFRSWQVVGRQVGHGVFAAKPTLIIDEANRLHEWSLCPSEQQHLITLQAWLTMITKEKGMANVILCSSEDFFAFWMNTHFGSQRYEVGVVGDLTAEQASKFLTEQLCQAQGGTRSFELPHDLWTDIYDGIGGRILLLKRLSAFLAPAVEEGEGAVRSAWTAFWRSTHAFAVRDMQSALDPACLPAKWSLGRGVDVPEGAVRGTQYPTWTKDEYVGVLRALADARDGVVSETTLLATKAIRRSALYSLVQHNFLRYRGPSHWGGDDLSWYDGGFPIFMPISRPHFHALRSLLAGLGDSWV